MAKKPTRGGRVTPKGTQPATTTKSSSKAQPAIDHRVVNHFDPASNQRRRRSQRARREPATTAATAEPAGSAGHSRSRGQRRWNHARSVAR